MHMWDADDRDRRTVESNMKLFLSGDLGSKDGEGEQTLAPLIHNRLLSYYYNVTRSNEPDEVLLSCKPRKQGVFLDSGAFSAFKIDAKIDINRFAEFCVKYADMFDLIASLDVIGDAKASERNYHILHDAGATKVFPTYHYSEPFSFLEKMKKESRVIGIGIGSGAARMFGHNHLLLEFLDQCWKRLTDSSGNPTHDIHGFAVTTIHAIHRYPWFSVDSTSWLLPAVYGLIPCLRDSGLIMQNISVTKVGKKRKMLSSHHYDVLSKYEQKWVRDYIKKAGFTIEQVEDGGAAGTLARQAVAVYSYQLLEGSAGTRLQSHQMTLGD